MAASLLDSPHPPVVGISGSNSDSASVRAMMAQISATGAIPLFLGNHINRKADDDFKKIDSIVILGNNRDIDPSEYGQMGKPDPHTKSELLTDEGHIDFGGVARRSYEVRMLELAMKHKMPVLGVCGGMQRINVMLGGQLHQHIPDMIGNEEHDQQNFGIAPFVPVQPVIIAPDSTLSGIAGNISSIYTPGHGAASSPTVVLENSMHHQAVSIVGAGLRASAFSSDKVKLQNGSDGLLIEAIEADPKGPLSNQFLMGVQWHPEFGASPLGAKISHNFANAAHEYARAHNRTHPMTEAINENVFSALPAVKSPTRSGSITEAILAQRAAASISSGPQVT
jgi:putative glutamine amidotransferase